MNSGRTLLAFFTVTAMIGGVAHGEGDLADLQFKYDVSRAELIKPVLELQKSYQTQLEKLRDQVRASGSLERTKAVDAEINGFRDGTAPPASDKFNELRRFQNIYATEATTRHKKALRDLPALVKSHKVQLETLQKALTQQDKLEQAEKVKEALSKIDETLGVTVPAPPTIGRATTPAVIEPIDPTKPFQKGENIFTNRDFVWGAVPEEFQKWQISMQPGGSKVGTRFKVKTPGLVYSVIGSSSEKDFKADGWKKVEDLRGGEDGQWEYLVMEKPFEPGDHAINGKGWFSTRVLLPPSSQRK